MLTRSLTRTHALVVAATLQLGGKNSAQIRALADRQDDILPAHGAWLRLVADALSAAGASSLSDLTPDQLRDVFAA